MNNEEIDFLVEGINSREANIKARIAHMNNASCNETYKIMRLLELLGEASGELAFIREQLLNNKKPIRKFALLCKG